MSDTPPAPHAPPDGTLQAWAWDYVHTRELTDKLAPTPPPERLEENAPVRRIESPGRPKELRVTWAKAKTPGRNAMRDPRRRAQLLHTFLHHELQAAELMCWAVLAFPETPDAFKRGLIGICVDEIRHMKMYAGHIKALGHRVGEFEVRDWFWERAPSAQTAAQYCALMGLGFEAGNLDHCARFAESFDVIGDTKGAQLTRVVAEEEITHVAFALQWFERFAGKADFDTWQEALPAPLSPMLMRGRPLNREAREKAGLSAEFIEKLERWQPSQPGS